ncbi:hypothetical protein ABIE79_009993 [Bradyrhizobium diazoefficiens]
MWFFGFGVTIIASILAFMFLVPCNERCQQLIKSDFPSGNCRTMGRSIVCH